MNIYDVYMDGEEAVISAKTFDVDEDGRLLFLVGEGVVAVFQADVWKWLEKRQIEENGT